MPLTVDDTLNLGGLANASANLEELGNFTGNEVMPVFTLPSATAAFGTEIWSVVPSYQSMIPRIQSIVYTSDTAQHTITVMRAVATTVANNRASASQAVIEFSNIGAMTNPNSSVKENVAANDFVVFVDDDGKQVADKVASVAGNNVTMTSALSTPVPEGAKIYIFGEVGRATHLQFSPPVSTTATLNVLAQGGIPGQLDTNNITGEGHPMIVHSDNVTAAGTIVACNGYYVAAPDYAIN